MKLSIRGRVLFLVLASVFAALLLVEAVLFYGLHVSRQALDEQEDALVGAVRRSVEECIGASRREGFRIDEAAAENVVEQVCKDALERTRNFRENREEILTASMAKAGLLLLPVLLLIVYASNYMAGRVTGPIRRLSDGVREIAAGNLDRKVDIHTGDEIEDLAGCFNDMTDELQVYVKKLTAAAAEKERIVTELAVARNIQMGALPKDFPDDRKRFLYTDGVTEAMDGEGRMYSTRRLQERFGLVDEKISVREALAAVKADIDSHVNGAEPSDDITMLGLKFCGAEISR